MIATRYEGSWWQVAYRAVAGAICVWSFVTALRVDSAWPFLTAFGLQIAWFVLLAGTHAVITAVRIFREHRRGR